MRLELLSRNGVDVGGGHSLDNVDHLVATFPNLEIEAIEAFLIANESIANDFDELERTLMMSLNGTKPTKESKTALKMDLSEFLKVVGDGKRPDAAIKTGRSFNSNFSFTCKIRFIIQYFYLLPFSS